ncbi:MAG: hypothetical protein GX102_04725 [Porphyromonadaceae bacterium]|nr:hypothetical protein [Porphyromonadaceae bacterium]
MKVGETVGNFQLTEQIKDVNELIEYLLNNKSIFWRHRVLPSAFFLSWQLRVIYNTVNGGYFWKINRINNKKNNIKNQ